MEVIAACFKKLYRHLFGGTEENHKTSGYLVTAMRFKPGTSQIWSRATPRCDFFCWI